MPTPEPFNPFPPGKEPSPPDWYKPEDPYDEEEED